MMVMMMISENMSPPTPGDMQQQQQQHVYMEPGRSVDSYPRCAARAFPKNSDAMRRYFLSGRSPLFLPRLWVSRDLEAEMRLLGSCD